MFPSSAAKIRQILEPISFKVVVNLGSSTKHFYQTKQPYIWDDVMQPLLQRGCALINVDQKMAKGVHVIGSAEEWKLDDFADVVLCCNILEHVVNPAAVLANIAVTLKKGGLLVIEGPLDYPKHEDPIDNMLRPASGTEWDDLIGEQFARKHFSITQMGTHTASVVCYRRR